MTMTGPSPSLATLDDPALLQLLLRQDLPPFLTTMYASEADRRMAAHDQPAVPGMMTLNLPFGQGDGQ
ncbi:MAG: hypothetical protein HZB34_07725 [Nitrospirae bacterium]|nr:hypothetical protein [Nitrospirota bacterium]